MVTAPVERLERLRMSWEDYLAQPDGVRAEYVDGEVVVTPPASREHNRTPRWVANAIEAHLDPALRVMTEPGWRPASRARMPDVAVFVDAEASTGWSTASTAR
jgi:Uma2 family endonuclease